MLKDIPQDLVTIWQQSVSIIPEGIFEIVYLVCVTFKGYRTVLCFQCKQIFPE